MLKSQKVACAARGSGSNQMSCGDQKPRKREGVGATVPGNVAPALKMKRQTAPLNHESRAALAMRREEPHRAGHQGRSGSSPISRWHLSQQPRTWDTSTELLRLTLSPRSQQVMGSQVADFSKTLAWLRVSVGRSVASLDLPKYAFRQLRLGRPGGGILPYCTTLNKGRSCRMSCRIVSSERTLSLSGRPSFCRVALRSRSIVLTPVGCCRNLGGSSLKA